MNLSLYFLTDSILAKSSVRLPAVLILLLFLVLSCSENTEVKTTPLLPTNSFTTQNLIPESYLVSSKLEVLDSDFVYWDRSISKLIILDSEGKIRTRLVKQMGQGPEEIEFFAGFNITTNYIFIYGQKCLVYDRSSLEFLGKYSIPKLDVDWIQDFNDQYVLGGLNYEENKYTIFSTDFHPNTGFSQRKEVAKIDFPKALDELSKITESVITKSHLYVLKPHIGELVKINRNFETVFDKPLPYRFNQKENIIKYQDGEIDLDKFESWSFTISGKKLMVLRDQDMSSKEPRSKTHRNTINVLDLNGELLKNLRLASKATFIYADNTRLYTVDTETEKYLTYEIRD